MSTKTNDIQNLDDAIEAGLQIKATYAPNGEVVKFNEFAKSGGKVEVEYQDGTLGVVDRGDLIDFSWN